MFFYSSMINCIFMKIFSMRRAYILISLFIGMSCTNPPVEEKQDVDFPMLLGKYLGQSEPGDSVELFASGIISTGLYTRDITISPNGKEIYFGVITGRRVFLMETHVEKGTWTEPRIAHFSGNENWFDFEPHISPDGEKIFFLSTRPPEGKEPKPGWEYQNIWCMDRTEEGWSEPYNIGEPVCTENNEYYATSTLDGALYFTRSTNADDAAIWRSEFVDTAYTEPERVSFANDSGLVVYNSVIAPDEGYIIACVDGLDSLNIPKYCIAFRNDSSVWSQLIPLDKRINFPGDRASSAFITNDKQFMFFASSRVNKKLTGVAPGTTISQLIDNLVSPQNGFSDIYWIRTDFINELNPFSNQEPKENE